MNFLADESVDRLIIDRTRRGARQVAYVAETQAGLTDGAVLEAANRQTVLLSTADKNFGVKVFRRRRFTGRAVLLRLSGFSDNRKAKVLVSQSTSIHRRCRMASPSLPPACAALAGRQNDVPSGLRSESRAETQRNHHSSFTCSAALRSGREWRAKVRRHVG